MSRIGLFAPPVLTGRPATSDGVVVCTTATRPASPYTGQAIYDTTTATQLIWNGTAWVGTGGLVRVGGGALSGTSTTFSSVFSATYDAYKVVLTNLLSSDHTYFQIGSATASYYSCGAKVTYGSTVSGQSTNNGSRFDYVGYSAGTNYFGATIEIQNPFLSVETAAQWTFVNTNPGDGSANMCGFLDTTASYTSFKIGAPNGTLTGTCNIYGYSLS
jgi:hypothetical protein